MSRFRFPPRQSAPGALVALVALGTITGLAVGVVLAERVGGLSGLRTSLRRLRQRKLMPGSGYDGFDELRPPEYSEAYAEEYDDDDFDSDLDNEVRDVEDLADAFSDVEAALESRVLEAFRYDPILSEQAIDIGAIGNGIIELTGWVHSADEVAHAITLARGVPDVAHVVDRLAIREIEAPRVGLGGEDR